MIFSQNKTDDRLLVGRVVLLALLCTVLIFAAIYVLDRNFSLGWFSSNSGARAENMQVVSSTLLYEILIDRTAEYDTVIAGNPKYDGVADLKTELQTPAYSYSVTDTSTQSADKLAYELQNEVSYWQDGVDYRNMMPGDCGTLTFYIRPFSASVVADLELSVGSFMYEYEGANLVVNEVVDPVVLNLLRGHILFFTERTGTGPSDYRYDGLLTDGRFAYSTAQHTPIASGPKAGCYEVTLYWEWPLTYYDIEENISATPGQKKYPAELGDFVDDERAYFFATNQNSNDPEDLNDGYNDGDQTIGEHANFIVTFIIPH